MKPITLADEQEVYDREASKGTASRVLDFWRSIDPTVKQTSPGQWRGNSPLRPGSNSNGFCLYIESSEYGAYHDHVTKESGSLYDLANKLPKRFDATETKRDYKDLSEYAEAHGASADVFDGWKLVNKEDKGKIRPALQFQTLTGPRWRFIDGEKPTYKSPPDYKICWYKLDEAIKLANNNQPLVICNGEASTIVAQHFGLAATAVTGGEHSAIPDNLLSELQEKWSGSLILAHDCDKAGKESSPKLAKQLKEVGFNVKPIDLGGKDGFDLADFCKIYKNNSPKKILESKTLPSGEWEFFTLADAYKPKPPREYVVNGLFPLPSLSIVYGTPGSLKTMFLLSMGLCVADGQKWLSFDTQKSGVLWLDVDSGQDIIERRLSALGNSYNIPPDAPFYYLSFPTPPFAGNDAESVDKLSAFIEEKNIKLIIMDCLLTISGNADENSAEMQHVMSGLRQISERTCTAVVVIHHCPKSNNLDLRGHSSIKGSIDLALAVVRENDSDTIILKTTKSRNAPVLPFAALWTYQSENKELVEAKFEETEIPEPDEIQGMKQDEKAEYLIQNSEFQDMNQTDLIKWLKEKHNIGNSSAKNAIAKLEKEGVLTWKDGKNNAKLYSNKKSNQDESTQDSPF